MTPLERVVAAEVRTHGPIHFGTFMDLALYHPEHGYYASGRARTGRTGHFLTSPEVDRAFGELWARFFEGVWASCGRPRSFDVIEVGPGEGSFAETVLASAAGGFAAALAYRLVERFPKAAGRQAERLARFQRVTWSSSVEDGPRAAAGCVFANEVLDNLPVRIVERRNGDLLEVRVGLDGDRLHERLAPAPAEMSAALVNLGVDLPEGHRYEIPAGADVFARAAARAVTRGAVVLIDYGDTAAALAARPAGTLLCYSDAGADDLFYERIGDKDITAHANWTAVRRSLSEEGLVVTGPVPQRTVLRSLGLGEAESRLAAEHDEAAEQGAGRAALRALSRRSALGLLADARGLGDLGVMTAYRDLRCIFVP